MSKKPVKYFIRNQLGLYLTLPCNPDKLTKEFSSDNEKECQLKWEDRISSNDKKISWQHWKIIGSNIIDNIFNGVDGSKMYVMFLENVNKMETRWECVAHLKDQVYIEVDEGYYKEKHTTKLCMEALRGFYEVMNVTK